MKRIILKPVLRTVGKPFNLPVFGLNDEPVVVDGKLLTEQVASLPILLSYFVLRGLPRERYTKNDAIHASDTYPRLREAKDGIIELPDDDYEWLKSKLNDDACGVRMFTIDQPMVMAALENIEKHQPKE